MPGPVASVVHPLSIRTADLLPGSQLQPGLSAAPETNYLPLLPSGPDGVRSVSPRRARLSTLTYREQSPRDLNLEREFDPAIADCGCRAPLAPRLARPNAMLAARNHACQAAHKCTGNKSVAQSTNCYVPVTVVKPPPLPHINRFAFDSRRRRYVRSQKRPLAFDMSLSPRTCAPHLVLPTCRLNSGILILPGYPRSGHGCLVFRTSYFVPRAPYL